MTTKLDELRRLECLRLANSPNREPEEVVARARLYYEFLSSPVMAKEPK